MGPKCWRCQHCRSRGSGETTPRHATGQLSPTQLCPTACCIQDKLLRPARKTLGSSSSSTPSKTVPELWGNHTGWNGDGQQAQKDDHCHPKHGKAEMLATLPSPSHSPLPAASPIPACHLHLPPRVCACAHTRVCVCVCQGATAGMKHPTLGGGWKLSPAGPWKAQLKDSWLPWAEG